MNQETQDTGTGYYMSDQERGDQAMPLPPGPDDFKEFPAENEETADQQSSTPLPAEEEIKNEGAAASTVDASTMTQETTGHQLIDTTALRPARSEMLIVGEDMEAKMARSFENRSRKNYNMRGIRHHEAAEASASQVSMMDPDADLEMGVSSRNGRHRHRVEKSMATESELEQNQTSGLKDLDMASSDGENSVLSIEQINQDNFRCISVMRPVFWIAYYFFCCCLISDMSRDQQRERRDRSVILNFRKTLKTLKKKRFIDSEVFNALVQLYRHKPRANNLLVQVRLNPDFLSAETARADLEFFIPQLCSFYLNPELTALEVEQLGEILSCACEVNFFFAHRVWFFFRSSIDYCEDEVQRDRIERVLMRMEAQATRSSEQLYLANSQAYLEVLHQTDQQFLVDSACQFRRLVAKGSKEDYLQTYLKTIVNQRFQMHEEFKETRSIINAKGMTTGNATQYTDQLLTSQEKAVNNSSGILLRPYRRRGFSNNSQMSSSDHLGYLPPSDDIEESKQPARGGAFGGPGSGGSDPGNNPDSNEHQYPLRAFKSTPNFIEALTDLGVSILTEEDDKKLALIEGLRSINEGLPSSVYIPFVNHSWRNYTVLNICENESKLFLTKNRAPYLVCLEIYRPEEVLVTAQSRYRQHLQQQTPATSLGMTQTEMPITDRLVHVNVIDQVLNPFLNRPGNEVVERQPNGNFLESQIHTAVRTVRIADPATLGVSAASLIAGQARPVSTELTRQLEKLNRNLDRQISQGHMIKNFFPEVRFEQRLPLIQAISLEAANDQVQTDRRQRQKSDNLMDSSRTPFGQGSYNNKGENSFMKFASEDRANDPEIDQTSVMLAEMQARSRQRSQYNDGSITSDNDTAFEDDNDEDLDVPRRHKKSSRYSSKRFNVKSRNEGGYASSNSAFGGKDSGAFKNYDSDAGDDDDARSSSTHGLYEGGVRKRPIIGKPANANKQSRHPTETEGTDPTSINQNATEYAHSPDSRKAQGAEEENKAVTILDNGLQEVKEDAIAEAQRSSHKPSTMSFGGSAAGDKKDQEAESEHYMTPAVNYLSYEPNFLFKEFAKDQEVRLRANSRFGHLQSWKLARVIVKSGDDLRLEQFAMQLISLMNSIFKRKKINLWLKPYEILATSYDCGLIEFCEDSLGVDYIKKTMSHMMNRSCDLWDYFRKNFGSPSQRGAQQKSFEKAQRNFADSLAAYSLVCYILQIKDRHNANMLLDKTGHLIHIDFGFMLTDAPGRGLRFETAPFKLSADFVQILGGPDGEGFRRFRNSMVSGMQALNKHSAKIILLVQMVAAAQSDLSCFTGGTKEAVDELKERLCPLGIDRKLSKGDCERYIDQLIYESDGNWRTQMYDGFQYCVQGIF